MLLFIWPFLSFAPLVLFIILYFKFNKENYKFNRNLLIFLISFSILIIGQAVLQGYSVSGKNIIRLTSQSFIHLLMFFFILFKKYKIEN